MSTRKNILRATVSGALVAAVAIFGAPGAFGADSPQGDTWQSIAKLPDWSGSWRPDRFVSDNQGDYPIPLTPPYAKVLAELRRIVDTYKVGLCVTRVEPKLIAEALEMMFDDVLSSLVGKILVM